MNCNECMEKLSLYIDHMLNEEEEKSLVAHLDLCEACRGEYEALRQMVDALKETETPELPKDFHETLMQRIRQEQKVVPIKTKRFKWGYPAGLVATVLVGFLVFSEPFNMSKNSESAPAPMSLTATQDETKSTKADVQMIAEETTGAPVDESNQTGSQVESRTTKEGANEVESTLYDEQGRESVWDVTITEKDTFLAALAQYLEEAHFAYTMEEGSVEITAEDYSALLAWLKTVSAVKEVSVTQETGSSLRLIYHQ